MPALSDRRKRLRHSGPWSAVSVLEAIAVIAVIAAVVAMVIWFFFFSRGGIGPGAL